MSEQPAAMAPPRGAVIARKMRMLTGVRESLLDKIPAERTRYTALAAVMICTATIGGFSMFFALSEVMGNAELWFLPLAVFWTAFILCIDCWLVSSTAGSRWRTRVSVLLPRLAIAAVFGVVIAEPLVLRVFQTGIVSHVQQQRQEAIDHLRTALVDCNPVPGIPPPLRPPGGCSGMILNISSGAAATQARIGSLQTQESALQNQVNTETKALTRLQNIVNDECNGISGPGLTGRVGDGPACQKDQGDVTSFQATHPLRTQEAEITSLQAQLTNLQGTQSGQQANYRAAITHAINSRLQQETQPSAPIGMAERFQALTYLSLSNAFIGVASWFVRIFFILIDCLPVLVKFISGSTPYDRLVDTETASAERRHSRANNTQDVIADEENAVTLRKAQADAARRMKEIDLEILRQDAARGTVKEDAVDDLWQKKLRARRAARATASVSPSRTGSEDTDRYTNGSSHHLGDAGGQVR
jgi:hypothetical protein